MQNLIKQEQFELQTLEGLNSQKILSELVFGGGTMLRLCFGLNRFSVDLDFWIYKDLDTKLLYARIKDYLSQSYTLTDNANKFHTMLFEIKSRDFPRKLKIEIRKEKKKVLTETAIAYSKYSNRQVFLRVVSLKDMMRSKIEAFLERKEPRDIFDIEFLLKKGIRLNTDAAVADELLKGINSFTKRDYRVRLGSLLEEGERAYYSKENFKILKAAIREIADEKDI